MLRRSVTRLLIAKLLKLALLPTLVLCIGVHAQAGVVITSEGNGGTAPTGPSVSTLTFDTASTGNGVRSFTQGGIVTTMSFTQDAAIVSGNASGLYAMPYANLAGPDTTNYASTGIGSVSFSFSTAQTYLGLLWGSVDWYNTLSFYDASGNLITAITGDNVASSANGDQGYYGTYFVNFSSDIAFSKVVASSSQYAFEFDDLSFRTASIVHDDVPVPEPASLAVLGAALAALTYLRRPRPVPARIRSK